LQQDFEVNIITLNPHLFSTHHMSSSQDTIKAHITTLLQDPKKEKIQPSLIFFQEFLEQGGTITPQIPTQADIEKELFQHRPLIALLTSNFLSKDASKFNFHFNVITGLENNTIYVNDPDQSD